MDPKSTLALVAALFVGLACGDDGEGDSGASDTATTSSSSGPSDTSSAQTSTTQSPTSTSTTEGTSTTTTTETTATTDSGMESSGGASCDPDANDDECRECVKATCCDHWEACQDDDICRCTLDCVLEGNSPGSCKNPCGGENELYQAVFFCGQMSCLGLCDWSCC